MPEAARAPQTLYDKVLQAHVVDEKLDGTLLLYIGLFPPVTTAVRAECKADNMLQIDTLFTR